MDILIFNERVTFAGFDWDAGNRTKCEAHGVSCDIVEAFMHSAFSLAPDPTRTEKRFRAIGYAPSRRRLFVVFTLREREGHLLIRPISARYMHQREVKRYEQENPGLQDG